MWSCCISTKTDRNRQDKYKTKGLREKKSHTHGRRKIPLTLLLCYNLPLDRSQKQWDLKWYSQFDERSSSFINRGRSNFARPKFKSFLVLNRDWLTLFKNPQLSYMTISHAHRENSHDGPLAPGHIAGQHVHW